MTKIEIKKDLISRLDEICEDYALFDDNGDYDINEALEIVLNKFDKNIGQNIANLIHMLENYKKEDIKDRFEII